MTINLFTEQRRFSTIVFHRRSFDKLVIYVDLIEMSVLRFCHVTVNFGLAMKIS